MSGGSRDPSEVDAWDSGLLQPGSTFARQLDTEGTYVYQDAENPAFSAYIIVEAATSKIYLPIIIR